MSCLFGSPVACAWCGKLHEAVAPGPTQGDGCATSLWERDGTWYLQGHYGSTLYDCDLFRFVRNHPTAPANPVCDDCITGLIQSGALVQIPGNFP